MSRLLCLGTAVFLLAAYLADAQCDTSFYTQADTLIAHAKDSDTTHGNTFIANVNQFCPRYEFVTGNDSGRVHLRFLEFAHARKWLRLQNWCEDSTRNWDFANKTTAGLLSPAGLSALSRTHDFYLASSDTVQFYRELFWVNAFNNAVGTDYYYNPNTIGYSIAIHKASDDSRIALLDTFLLASTTSDRKPCIHAWYPMISRVRYVSSSGFSACSVYVKVNVFSSVNDSNQFIRQDYVGGAVSGSHLSSSSWKAFNVNVSNNINCSTSCSVTVATLSSPSRAQITVSSGSGLDNVSIYEPAGALVSSTSIPAGSNPFEVTLSSGLYIVAGKSSGSIVCTRLVLIP